MKKQFTVSVTIKAPAKRIYAAWLSSKEHAAMTGGAAKVTARAGGKFTAWDGYIHGKNLKLVPGKKIIQSWRTSEFAESDPDSQIELTFAEGKRGTKLTLRHTNLPENGMQYKMGWVENYFEPMKEYFEA